MIKTKLNEDLFDKIKENSRIVILEQVKLVKKFLMILERKNLVFKFWVLLIIFKKAYV